MGSTSERLATISARQSEGKGKGEASFVVVVVEVKGDCATPHTRERCGCGALQAATRICSVYGSRERKGAEGKGKRENARNTVEDRQAAFVLASSTPSELRGQKGGGDSFTAAQNTTIHQQRPDARTPAALRCNLRPVNQKPSKPHPNMFALQHECSWPVGVWLFNAAHRQHNSRSSFAFDVFDNHSDFL